MPREQAFLAGPAGVVATDVREATTPWSRLRGVLGRAALGPSDALLIAPCRRVHTFGVRYAIDAVFCDASLRVLHVETLVPRRVSARVAGGHSCIELAAGRAAACGIEPGVVLRLEAP